ncbi:antigen like protein, partial [Clarias magur]
KSNRARTESVRQSRDPGKRPSSIPAPSESRDMAEGSGSVVLQHITWPHDGDEDDDCSLDSHVRLSIVSSSMILSVSSRRYQDIMTSCFSLYIVWGTVCVSLLSAARQFSVSGTVGSTAVLPCKLASVGTGEPSVFWSTGSVTVFQRIGEKSVHTEGYEGRVDVPLEELNKGICALVFRDLRLNDTGVYTSEQPVRHRPNSLPSKVQLSHVKLSVY